MLKSNLILGLLVLFVSCKEIQKSPSLANTNKPKLEVSYAKGFTINYFEEYKVIEIKNPWPGSSEVFKYALVENDAVLRTPEAYDAVVRTPVSKIVVTSTTHIPSLEILGVSESLVGFPNLDYISSEKTRKRIEKNEISELGKNEDINTEVLIDLSPDVLIGFAVDGNNTAMNTVQRSGIPVVYNGDWTETSPLGKAEWIKFFAAFYNKESAADSIFNTIEANYNQAKEVASRSKIVPSVMSGAMYKDVWYLPQGDSWAAQFINDANGNYLWKDAQGTGSLSLNLESVLEKGQSADYWIGPGQFTSLQQLEDTHTVYTEFDAFKKGEVYSFTTKKGATGGVLYYELAPNRPDLVLKDIIKILHPDLSLDHQLYFFTHIE